MKKKKSNHKEGLKLLLVFPIMIAIIFTMGFMFFGIILTAVFTTIMLLVIEGKGIKKSWKEARKETMKIIKQLTR